METKLLEHSHSYNIRVRYADTDKMGFVYNGEYLSYFEIGRTELMRAMGLPYTEFENLGFMLPLVEAHVVYKNAAYYDDLLEVQATIHFDKNKATFKISYNIFRSDTTIAVGYTVHSFMRSDTKRATRPPKIFIEMLERYIGKNRTD